MYLHELCSAPWVLGASLCLVPVSPYRWTPLPTLLINPPVVVFNFAAEPGHELCSACMSSALPRRHWELRSAEYLSHFIGRRDLGPALYGQTPSSKCQCSFVRMHWERRSARCSSHVSPSVSAGPGHELCSACMSSALRRRSWDLFPARFADKAVRGSHLLSACFADNPTGEVIYFGAFRGQKSQEKSFCSARFVGEVFPCQLLNGSASSALPSAPTPHLSYEYNS